ncbi:MAG: MarR family transcriptional regulator, partial [Nocardioidaceae bacterium]
MIPATTSGLRRHNTARVLRALRDRGPLSRTDIARHTGLAKATVGTIVADLGATGAVEEHATDTSSRGRPSRPVGLDGRRFVALGV